MIRVGENSVNVYMSHDLKQLKKTEHAIICKIPIQSFGHAINRNMRLWLFQ